MSFAKDYMGDTKTLALITKTVEQKNAVIPDVTVKRELSGLLQENVAEYWYNLAPNIVEAPAGSDFNTTNVGSRKAVMPLTQGLQFDERIPNVAVDTTEARLVDDVVGKSALAMANRVGAKFIDAISQLAQQVTVEGDDIYERIIDAQAVFSGLSSTRIGASASTDYSNAVNGIQPTTIIVGNEGRKQIQKSEAFQRIINATGLVRGLIGEMLGLNVVYAQDLTDYEFIMLYPEGVAFPFSIMTLRTVDSENFNGIRVQGEVVIAEQAAPVGQNPGVWNWAILPIDSHAIKVALPAAPNGNGGNNEE